ncbi:MAG: PH domain-containing protein [Bacteroidota bacterium]
MRIRYYSKKDRFFKMLFVFLAILGIVSLTILFTSLFTESRPFHLPTLIICLISLLMLLLIAILCIDVWKNTYYIIRDNDLYYRMGMLKGSIALEEVHSILPSEYRTSGIRPALAWNGILIRYGTDRKLFLSPKEESLFVAALNEKIKKNTPPPPTHK